MPYWNKKKQQGTHHFHIKGTSGAAVWLGCFTEAAGGYLAGSIVMVAMCFFGGVEPFDVVKVCQGIVDSCNGALEVDIGLLLIVHYFFCSNGDSRGWRCYMAALQPVVVIWCPLLAWTLSWFKSRKLPTGVSAYNWSERPKDGTNLINADIMLHSSGEIVEDNMWQGTENMATCLILQDSEARTNIRQIFISLLKLSHSICLPIHERRVHHLYLKDLSLSLVGSMFFSDDVLPSKICKKKQLIINKLSPENLPTFCEAGNGFRPWNRLAWHRRVPSQHQWLMLSDGCRGRGGASTQCLCTYGDCGWKEAIFAPQKNGRMKAAATDIFWWILGALQ